MAREGGLQNITNVSFLLLSSRPDRTRINSELEVKAAVLLAVLPLATEQNV